jgi:hypothetical protein
MRRATISAIVAAAASVVAGCGGTTDVGAGAAGFIPAGVPAFVSVNTDLGSEQWRTLATLAAKLPGRANFLQMMKRGFQHDEGVSWDKDLQPALGDELVIAWLDFDHGGGDIVGLVRPRDVDAFKRVIADTPEHLVFARVGEWYVVSDRRATLQLFRRLKSKTQRTLADDATARDALGALPRDSLVHVYVNGHALHRAIARQPEADAKALVNRLGRLDWLAANVRAQSDGVRLDVTLHGRAGRALTRAAGHAFEPELTHNVPADAYAYLGFHGSRGMLTQLVNLTNTTGFDLLGEFVRPIAPLFEGENALYVRPGDGQIPEVTLVMEPRKGIDALHRLRSYLSDYLGGAELSYAKVGDRLVVSDLPGGIAAFKHHAKALADDEDFRDAGMQPRVRELVWVDVRGALGAVQRLGGTHIPAEVVQNVKPLRSAVEYAASRTRELQITVLLKIQ